MKSHKRFLVWVQIEGKSQIWLLAGESSDWSRASNLALSCLDRNDAIDVMINEFVPIELTDAREITFHNQSVAHDDEDQFATGVVIDKRSGKVLVDGKARILSSSEFTLLSLLYERESEIVSKSDITSEVWNDKYIPHPKSNARIEQLIHRLRRRLESDPSNPKYIINMRERGYTLNREGKG